MCCGVVWCKCESCICNQMHSFLRLYTRSNPLEFKNAFPQLTLPFSIQILIEHNIIDADGFGSGSNSTDSLADSFISLKGSFCVVRGNRFYQSGVTRLTKGINAIDNGLELSSFEHVIIDNIFNLDNDTSSMIQANSNTSNGTQQEQMIYVMNNLRYPVSADGSNTDYVGASLIQDLVPDWYTAMLDGAWTPSTPRLTPSPTHAPTPKPTPLPSRVPSPTLRPTPRATTLAPTLPPTTKPTPIPTLAPTLTPTSKPTTRLTPSPTLSPTGVIATPAAPNKRVERPTITYKAPPRLTSPPPLRAPRQRECNFSRNLLFVSSVTQTTALITWPQMTGAQSYKLRFKRQQDATWIHETGIFGFVYFLYDLEPFSKYSIELQIFCTNRAYSEWSIPSTFHTLGAEGQLVVTPSPTPSPVDRSQSHVIYANWKVNADFWTDISTNGIFDNSYNDGGAHRSTYRAELEPGGKVHFVTSTTDRHLTGRGKVRFFMRSLNPIDLRVQVNDDMNDGDTFTANTEWKDNEFDFAIQGSDINSISFENTSDRTVAVLLDDIRFLE